MMVNSNQTQKDLMEPPRQRFQQKNHITAQSHIKKKTELLICESFCTI